MAAERADASPQAEELDEVILAYVEAVEAGKNPDRADWLARYPRLANELAAFFADQDQFSSLVAPIRAETPRPSSSRIPEAVVLEAPAPLASGCLVGDYELLDEIACGGMGVVYRARHRTLRRVVALKMIRSGEFALPEDVARFRLEAEAVANLDHPNIVPIYDVGQHEGQPYFAMKLIEGGNLASERPAAGSRPTQRRAARLVATVARAVHHAHQRGILHRDLKPANILLDKKGEPHVTDFGLATRLPSAAAATGASTTPSGLTQKGIAVGTPGYMAPEQANGPKKRVTVAADVYALGAVLFELLTGRPPFKGNTPLETLVQVLDQPPPRPRALAPSLSHDLDTICLKCLEKDPARRYPSALALADDLQRFLDGEPIQARATGPAGRLWRWCRRSPVVAVLAALLVVAVSAGLVAVTVLWRKAEDHANRVEELSKLYQSALSQADEEEKVVVAERERAEALRREAEENFHQAHQIVDRICMRLSEDRLSAFPGLQPLRKEILEVGLKYYQGFVAKRGDDPALKADLAKAHFQVAFLTNLVGSKRDALASYVQAQKTYDELLAADPENARYREEMAMTCINMGGILEALNDKQAALASYGRARKLLEDLDRAQPDTPKVLAHLGVLYNNLGNVNRGLGRHDDSRDAYDKALAVQERLHHKDPQKVGPQRELAVVYVNKAILCSTRGEKDETLLWFQKARDLQENLLRDHPNDREVQHDLALTYRRQGERLVRDGKVEDGLCVLEKGHKLIQELADLNKSVTDYQWELALSHRALGHARKAAGQKAEALAAYGEAIFCLGRARRQDPSLAAFARDLAATLFDRALLLADDKKVEAALRDYAAAADLYRELARPGTDADALADLAATCNNIGMLRRDALHRPDDALAAFNECRDARERLVRLRPDDPRCRNDLAAAWFGIGRAQDFLKRRDEEIRAYERSREIREALVRDFPQSAAFHHDLGASLINLGNAYAVVGRIDDSLATLRRAVEQKRVAFTAAPQSAEFRKGLNIAYGALAEVERKKGSPAAAAAALLERRKLWPNEPQELYRIAREQADTAARVGGGEPELGAADQAERATYHDQAIETLRLAVAAGFADADRLRADPDFAPLRPRDDFQKLLEGLKK
jgi:tetratricopeptide (TPR) repeat protein